MSRATSSWSVVAGTATTLRLPAEVRETIDRYFSAADPDQASREELDLGGALG